MKAFKLALIALATSLCFGIANADEASKVDVVVVTTARPEVFEPQTELEIEKATLAVELPVLAIEAPSLDELRVEIEAERIEVALNGEAD